MIFLESLYNYRYLVFLTATLSFLVKIIQTENASSCLYSIRPSSNLTETLKFGGKTSSEANIPQINQLYFIENIIVGQKLKVGIYQYSESLKS